MSECPICLGQADFFSGAKIRGKYDGQLFRCTACGFVFFEKPNWLSDAYQSPINVLDTGYVQRNLETSAVTAALIESLVDPLGRFVDFGAGHGLFVRLMRDRGYDFLWKDKHTTNLFARGFEWTNCERAELVTAFEVFEHLQNPREALKELSNYSDCILLTTALLPTPAPKPEDWWYYGLSHGQHISFFSFRALCALAASAGYHCVSDGGSWHLFSRRKIRVSVLTRAKRPWFQIAMRMLHPRSGLQWTDHCRLEKLMATEQVKQFANQSVTGEESKEGVKLRQPQVKISSSG